MKKIVNFLDKKIEKVDRYKEYKIELDLNKDLDLPYSVFLKKLNKEVERQLEEDRIYHYVGDVVIKVYTKLPRIELRPLKDLIISAVANFLVKDKTRFKTERIYGLRAFKDFDKIELPLVTLMDLVNHPLKQESFNIGVYDEDNLLYKSLVNW